VVPVAARAGGSRDVTVLDQDLIMDTLLIILQLIRRDLVVLHVLGVSVTSATGLRDLDRIGPGRLVFDGTDRMDIMATDTDGDVFVTLAQFLAVNTRVVFLHLVSANLWIEFPHVARIAMTLAAECWDVLTLRFAEKAFGAAVTGLLVVESGMVPAMTVLALQSSNQVVVISDFLGRPTEALFLQTLVAVDAGVHRRRRRDSEEAESSQDKEAKQKFWHDPHV